MARTPIVDNAGIKAQNFVYGRGGPKVNSQDQDLGPEKVVMPQGCLCGKTRLKAVILPFESVSGTSPIFRNLDSPWLGLRLGQHDLRGDRIVSIRTREGQLN